MVLLNNLNKVYYNNVRIASLCLLILYFFDLVIYFIYCFFHQSCETITAGLNESKQEEEEDYIGILAEQQTTQI